MKIKILFLALFLLQSPPTNSQIKTSSLDGKISISQDDIEIGIIDKEVF